MKTVMSEGREKALLYTLMALQFTMIVDFMIMMPLSSQLMKVFNIQPGQFGLLVSAYSIAAGVSSLIASSIADKFDRRHSLLVSYIGLIIATMACAFANSYELLLSARIVAGFFGGVLSSIVLAMVGDIFPPQKRGKAMGIVMLAFSLATIAGVPLGLFISNHFSWQTPFSSLAIASTVVLAIAYKVVPNVREHLNQPNVNFFQSYVDLFKVKNHWWAFLTSCLLMISGFMVIPYIAPTMVSNAGVTDAQLPYIYFAGGLATLVTRPLISRMTDTYRHAHVFAIVTTLSIIPIVLITHTLQTPFYIQVMISTLFFILVSGRFIPASALVTASCEPIYRGRVMAFSSALQNLGSGAAAFVAGMIMIKAPNGEILNYDVVGYIACAVSVAVIFAAMKVKAVS